MNTYQIKYETEDGAVEAYTTDTRLDNATKIARHCSYGSSLNRPLQVNRWFVEWQGQTLETFEVAAR